MLAWISSLEAQIHIHRISFDWCLNFRRVAWIFTKSQCKERKKIAQPSFPLTALSVLVLVLHLWLARSLPLVARAIKSNNFCGSQLKLILTAIGLPTASSELVLALIYALMCMQYLWNHNRNQFLLVNWKTPMEFQIDFTRNIISGAQNTWYLCVSVCVVLCEGNFKHFSSCI